MPRQEVPGLGAAARVVAKVRLHVADQAAVDADAVGRVRLRRAPGRPLLEQPGLDERAAARHHRQAPAVRQPPARLPRSRTRAVCRPPVSRPAPCDAFSPRCSPRPAPAPSACYFKTARAQYARRFAVIAKYFMSPAADAPVTAVVCSSCASCHAPICCHPSACSNALRMETAGRCAGRGAPRNA